MKTTQKIVAEHVMSRRVATLSPAEPIESALRTFTEARISGAPVVDEEGRIVGILSLSDIARSERLDDDSFREQEPAYDLAGPLDEEGDEDFDPSEIFFLKEEYSAGGGITVADRMTREVVCVGPETSLEQLSEVMVSQRIHRVLVTRDSELLGVVSSFDVVRAVAGRLGRKAKSSKPAKRPAGSHRRG
jgi:CBS domain-containing protein